MTRAALVAVLVVVGCARERPAISSCADSLAGVWRAPDGDWELLDRGPTLEAYPLFDDAPGPSEAPRTLALSRTTTVTGDQRRRYTDGGASCIGTTPVRITACATHQLELVRADIAPPLSFTPCTFSARSHPSRREVWARVF